MVEEIHVTDVCGDHGDEGDSSPRGESVMILGSEMNGKDSQASCATLGEDVWNPTPDGKGDEFLSYLGYKDRGHPPGRYWVASEDAGKGRSITPQGEIKPEDLSSKLPVICTHSAPNTYTKDGADTSERWHTTVKTGDLEVTGYFLLSLFTPILHILSESAFSDRRNAASGIKPVSGFKVFDMLTNPSALNTLQFIKVAARSRLWNTALTVTNLFAQLLKTVARTVYSSIYSPPIFPIRPKR